MLMNARTNLIEFFRALTCLCLIQLYLLQRREPTPLLPLCYPSIFRGTELYNNFVFDNLSCIGKGAPIPFITNQMCCLRTPGDISTAVLVVSDDAGLHALVYAYILAAARRRVGGRGGPYLRGMQSTNCRLAGHTRPRRSRRRRLHMSSCLPSAPSSAPTPTHPPRPPCPSAHTLPDACAATHMRLLCLAGEKSAANDLI